MRTAILLVLTLLFTGCASEEPGPTTPTPETPTPATNMTAAALAVSLVDRTPGVAVPPTTMGIEPAQLTLRVGERVNLTVTNDGQSVHNLVIEGLGVQTDDLDAGASQSIEFTPTEAGTYRMYCSIGGESPVGHDAQGMHGEVLVE